MKFWSAFSSATLALSLVAANHNHNLREFKDDIPSVELVRDMVLLSELVYYIHSPKSSKIPPGFRTLFFTETDRGTEVIVLAADDERNYIAVVLRGTEETVDVITDLNAFFTKLGPPHAPIKESGRVHNGFNKAAFSEDPNAYKKVETVVKMHLKNHPSHQVVFTGHSLGGAMATIMGAYMAARMKDQQISVINFASPRVGDYGFRQWANEVENLAIWRFVYDSDMIPRMPPQLYWHAGHLIQLQDNYAKLYYEQIGNETIGFAGAPRVWDWESNPFDHPIKRYSSYIGVKSVGFSNKFYVNQFEPYNDCPWWRIFCNSRLSNIRKSSVGKVQRRTKANDD